MAQCWGIRSKFMQRSNVLLMKTVNAIPSSLQPNILFYCLYISKINRKNKSIQLQRYVSKFAQISLVNTHYQEQQSVLSMDLFIFFIYTAHQGSPMHSSQLFTKLSPRPVSIKVESKQEFFSIKKNHKRMKVSQCFSEPIERQTPEQPLEDLNFIFNNKDDFSKTELQSTFGSQSVLAFKVKPPKRKKNTKIQAFSNHHNQCESQSDNETSNINKLRLNCKKINCCNSPDKNFDHLPKVTKVSSLDINQFHIISKLGEGTYSQVYRAIHKATGFLCAIKILQKWKMIELNVVENVLRQIKINYFIDHPNIAKIYSFFDDRNYIYLICQYATDKNIFQLINQPRIKLTKGLFSQTVSKIIYQLCDAVKFIHNHSVIHRDIKPQNILITMFDTIKLCDFGWSVYNPSKEMRSTLCGTPLYLAPELIKQAEYDESVDVWAVGVLTYQMMTKQNPFKITQLRDLEKVLYDQVRFEGIRNKFAIDFIKKAMQKDPYKRKTIYELINHPFLTPVNENYFTLS